MGVKEEQVLAGNGSDEMLGLMIGLHIHAGDRLYTLTPDFSMYDYYVGMHDGAIVRFERGADTPFDVDAFIARGREADVRMVLFSNPNNPTGQIIRKKDLCRIVEAFDCPVCAVSKSYENGVTDEFVVPCTIKGGEPISANDSIVFFNSLMS